MEVHTHAHTERKKLTHYFWEFFMLFLAVTLGFFVENKREHYVEHQREKQYMVSMLEDLKKDTAQINSIFNYIDNSMLPVQQETLPLLYLDQFNDSTIRQIYALLPRSIGFVTFSFQDRTSSQLKNSGNLRLIRSAAITDSLADYWSACELLKTQLSEGYDDTRKAAKELTFSILSLDHYENYYPWANLKEDHKLSFLTTDKVQFRKLGNYISNMFTQLSGPFKQNLAITKEKATGLIGMIGEEYHLE